MGANTGSTASRRACTLPKLHGTMPCILPAARLCPWVLWSPLRFSCCALAPGARRCFPLNLRLCCYHALDCLATGAQIDLVQGMMDCLYAKCIPCITDCVLAELEKLGQKYRVALKVAKARILPSCTSWVALCKCRVLICVTSCRALCGWNHGGFVSTRGGATVGQAQQHSALERTAIHVAHRLLVLAAMQDPRIERIPCTHKGTYADDCICERIRQHKCYIVATCDRDLRRRIRKVSGALSRVRSGPQFRPLASD